MKFKKIYAIAFLVISLSVCIIALLNSIKSYRFKDQILDAISKDKISYKILSTGFTKKDIPLGPIEDISNLLKDYFEWETTDGNFKRGGEYPFYIVEMNTQSESITLTLTIDEIQKVLRLFFQSSKNAFLIDKKIESQNKVDILRERIELIPNNNKIAE